MISDDDRIETVIELRAPVSRVWRALADSSTGHMLEPGWEHVPWLATVERMDPERLFAFRRLEALRSNTQGWDIQAGRIAGHVAG